MQASPGRSRHSQEASSTMEKSACHQANGWTEFTSSWNAFGSTATSWWESAAASWQPALRETEESPKEARESAELARAKRDANQESFYPDYFAAMQRSQVVRSEFSKRSTATSTSSSSGSEEYEDESIWDTHNISRLDAFNKIIQEERGEVEVTFNSKDDEGCCQSFLNKSLRYKFAVLLLVLAIVACSVVVALASMDIANKTSENENSNSSPAEDYNLLQDPSSSSNSRDDTGSPTKAPTKAPTRTPYPLATPEPTTPSPTTSPPTEEEILVTYIPGKLTVSSNGLLLSEGLKSRIVATAGQPVTLNGLPPLQTSNSNGNTSSENVYYKSSQSFHTEPDGAAIFPWAETGGWVYVSNSESKDKGTGGVGAIYFDKDGNVLDYQRLLDGTTMNCGGGPTPWGTWVTCEETDGGKAYQVDPFGIRPAEPLSTLDTGFFEAFAHDVRNPQKPKFYVTEDKERGPLRRIIPSTPDWEDPWEILHGLGTLEYLVLVPNALDDNNSGTYYWTTDRETAKVNSQQYYKHSEGIDVHNDQLFFVSKHQKELFILNLDDKTYEVHSTVSGVFDGHPDQMKRLIHDGLLYFCEEGGQENGVHARDENGWFFSILESETLSDETTGLDFSPDGMHMYVSYQHNGLIFDVWREDGLPFHGRTLNVKYHEIQRR